MNKHRLYTWVKLSTSTALYILCIVILVKTYHQVKNFKIELDYEFQNWKQPMVSDIQLSDTPCSQKGYKTWTYEWPGSKDSCDCRLSDRFSLTKSNLEAKIYWKKCDVDMAKCSCK
jgi:hypothetical protein